MSDEPQALMAVLVDIRDELRSWRAPAPATGCQHSEDDMVDMSDMREIHLRCRACKQEWRKERNACPVSA